MSWRENERSIGYAKETAFGVVNTTGGDFRWLDADPEFPELPAPEIEWQRPIQAFGANPVPVMAGGRHGKIKLKLVAQTCKAGYAPTTGDVPGVTAGVLGDFGILLANALGSNNAGVATNADLQLGAHLDAMAYAADDAAAGSGAAQIKVDDGRDAFYKNGCLAVVGKAATLYQVGWVKTCVNHTPAAADIDLFEAAAVTAADNDEKFPSATGFLSTDEQIPLTLRYAGPHDNYHEILVGCICEEFELDLKAGERPMLALTYRYTDHYAAAGGGYKTPTSYQHCPHVDSLHGGRVCLDGVVTGLAELKLTGKLATHYTQNGNGRAGEGANLKLTPELRLDCKVYWARTDTPAAYDSLWQASWRAGTAHDISVLTGSAPGQMLAMLCPQWILAETPKVEVVEGVRYWSLSFMPGVYTGDSTGSGAASDATDTVLRFAIA